jgi:hypothetical protein
MGLRLTNLMSLSKRSITSSSVPSESARCAGDTKLKLSADV